MRAVSQTHWLFLLVPSVVSVFSHGLCPICLNQSSTVGYSSTVQTLLLMYLSSMRAEFGKDQSKGALSLSPSHCSMVEPPQREPHPEDVTSSCTDSLSISMDFIQYPLLDLLPGCWLRPQVFPGLLLTSWPSFKFTGKPYLHRTESKVMQRTAMTWDYS